MFSGMSRSVAGMNVDQCRRLRILLGARPRAAPCSPFVQSVAPVAAIFGRVFPRSRRLCCALIALAAGAFHLRAAEPALAAPVALPPFFVEEIAKGPPWRYASALGFEVLSRCDERSTRRVIEAYHRLYQLLEEILPSSLQAKWTVPRTLILYPDELQPKASREVVEKMLRDHTPVPSLELDLPGGRRMSMATPASRRLSFLPNIRLMDRDCVAVFMIVRTDDFDAEKLALTEDAITLLITQRSPGLPVWFMSGFLDLYREIESGGGALRAKPLVWINEEHTDMLKRDPAKAPPVLDLATFLRTPRPPAASDEAIPPIKYWQAQAALFVRWGLASGDRNRREVFWKFVEQCSLRAPTEDVFRSCFGMDYATAQPQLAAYLPNATWVKPVFAPKKFARMERFPIPLATDVQVARIKGDLERLEVPFVKNISPDLVPRYLEQARKTLRRGFERVPTDAQLLAVMGLCELDAGDPVAARDYLERGAEHGTMRPRALYELARLRLAALRAAGEGEGGRLSVSQLTEVLKPLFAARESQPALHEVYELIGEAWAASSAPATRKHLAVLDEGIRLFPRRVSLMLVAAELYARHGFRVEADNLLEVAGLLAAGDDMKVKVAALREKLGR